MKYYLAIDIGASSGRHILSWIDNGKLQLQEIYRFKNGFSEKDGHLCWDIDRLFSEIKEGMKKCREIGKIPVSVAIDTWGVDYVLLDKDDNRITNAVSYRDNRTNGMDKKVEAVISEAELYSRTGLQKQMYNTIYQLMSEPKEIMDKAESFLMIAPYLNFLLTGNKMNEYTNVTTTGLVNAKTGKWDTELIESLGLKSSIFGEIYQPKTVVGMLTGDIQQEIGYNCKVILPATHDTASAVLAVREDGEDNLFLSSGTWSLLGFVSDKANCSEESRLFGLSNEGSAVGTTCCLKNIMGLWIIQSIKRNLEDKYSFPELSAMARDVKEFPSYIDVNDNDFMAPDNMIDAIRGYCKKTNQAVPESIGEVMQCVYQSLAKCYKETADAIEGLQKKTYRTISIVGGGCQDTYLNEMTEKFTGKKVTAGPVEATAIGNILIQMLTEGEVKDLKEAKKLI